MKKVLVIDDDHSILEVVKIMLNDAGYDVQAVSDKQSFHKYIYKSPPDLILADIWMPGFDIYGIKKYLENKKSIKKARLIVFSALATAEKIAKEVKADDFLPKPFDMDDLLKTVEKHIGKP